MLSDHELRTKFFNRLGPSPVLEDVLAAVWRHGPIIVPAKSSEDIRCGPVMVTGVSSNVNSDPLTWQIIIAPCDREPRAIFATVHHPFEKGEGEVLLEKNENFLNAWAYTHDSTTTHEGSGEVLSRNIRNEDITQPSISFSGPPTEPCPPPESIFPVRDALRHPHIVSALVGVAVGGALVGALAGVYGVLSLLLVGILIVLNISVRQI